MALMAVLYLVGPTAQQLIAFVAELRARGGPRPGIDST